MSYGWITYWYSGTKLLLYRKYNYVISWSRASLDVPRGTILTRLFEISWAFLYMLICGSSFRAWKLETEHLLNIIFSCLHRYFVSSFFPLYALRLTYVLLYSRGGLEFLCDSVNIHEVTVDPQSEGKKVNLFIMTD